MALVDWVVFTNVGPTPAPQWLVPALVADLTKPVAAYEIWCRGLRRARSAKTPERDSVARPHCKSDTEWPSAQYQRGNNKQRLTRLIP